MVRLGIDFHLIASCGNVFKVLFHERIIPSLVKQTGTIASSIIVHLVRMSHYIEPAQLQHTPQPSVVQAHHLLQVAAKLLIHYLPENIGRNIHIHHFAPFIIQHVHGTDAIIQRQFTKTGSRRIALFI